MTYAELKAEIAKWSKRTDLTALIPGFIQLAETRLGRELRVRQMEKEIADTPISAAYEIALPADFAALKAVWPSASPSVSIKPQSLSVVLSHGVQAGTPTLVAVTASSLRFNGVGSVTGVYFSDIPPLSDASPSNWLLSEHSDAYLFAALTELSSYVENGEQEAKWAARSNQVIKEIQNADMRDRFSGALTARKG